MDDIDVIIFTTMFVFAPLLVWFVIYMANRSEYMRDLKNDRYDPGWGMPWVRLKDLPRIKLKTFKEWYAIAPECWNIDRSMWAQRIGNKGVIVGVVFYPYIEHLKYKRWKKKIFKEKDLREQAENQRKNLESVLTCVQSDINRIKKQSEMEIEEAKNQMIFITKENKAGKIKLSQGTAEMPEYVTPFGRLKPEYIPPSEGRFGMTVN